MNVNDEILFEIAIETDNLIHDNERLLSKVSELENYVDELHDKHQSELQQKEFVIDELEQEVTELEEQNYEYEEKIRDLEYELEERNSNYSYLIKQLIQLARNNVTPYSQQDNDIWGIQQDIEKIIGVDLND